MLGLVTCYFNPAGYRRLRENYWTFRSQLGHPITTVELTFGDQQPEISDAIQLKGTGRNVMWQKERLLNVAIESLPECVDKVAWIDADFVFENGNWFRTADEMLDEFPVVQLFETVTDLDPSKSELVKEDGWAYAQQHQITKGFHRPGGGWAFRREAIPNGIYDKAPLGAGDVMQLTAWSGRWDNWYLKRLHPIHRREFLEWAIPAYRAVRNKISYVPGNVNHLFHGTRENRQYCEREQILTDNGFLPSEDITVENNLLAWASSKPDLHKRVAAYFESRREDE